MSVSIKKISQLQKKILDTKKEIAELNKLEQPMPELIKTTNLLRSNEYLVRENKSKSALLNYYEQYSAELEKLVLSTSIIKTQIKKLKSSQKSRKRKSTKTRKKTPKRKKAKVRKKLKKRSR